MNHHVLTIILGMVIDFLTFKMGVVLKVVLWADCDLLQEHATSIFRVAGLVSSAYRSVFEEEMCSSYRQVCKSCDQSEKLERLEWIDHIVSE
jgi:hypothetical protein